MSRRRTDIPAEAEARDGVAVAAELVAVLVALTAGEPRVLTIGEADALPSGLLEIGHRSLQSGLREPRRPAAALPNCSASGATRWSNVPLPAQAAAT